MISIPCWVKWHPIPFRYRKIDIFFFFSRRLWHGIYRDARLFFYIVFCMKCLWLTLLPTGDKALHLICFSSLQLSTQYDRLVAEIMSNIVIHFFVFPFYFPTNQSWLVVDKHLVRFLPSFLDGFRPWQTLSQLTNQLCPRSGLWNLWLGLRENKEKLKRRFYIPFRIRRRKGRLKFVFFFTVGTRLYLETFLFCMQFLELFLVAFFNNNPRHQFATAPRHIFKKYLIWILFCFFIWSAPSGTNKFDRVKWFFFLIFFKYIKILPPSYITNDFHIVSV